VLDNNDTLAKIDLTQATPVEVTDIRVGNVPTASWSPPMARPPTSPTSRPHCYRDRLPGILQRHPGRRRISTGATKTGTVSVVDLATFKVTDSIETGLHPTGMAFWHRKLLVAMPIATASP